MTLKRLFSRQSPIKNTNGVSIEECESRLFQSISYYSSSAPLVSSGSYSSSFLLGDNGDAWGDPTLYMGAGTTITDVSYFNWGTAENGGLSGFDTITSLSVNSSSAHLATWSVNYNTLESFSVSPSTTVHSVTLGATVYANGLAFSFSNVVITFFNASGSSIETINVENFAANTRNSEASNAEAAAVVSPSGGSAAGVIVSAKVRIDVNDGVYPNSTDVFGKIAIA